MQEAAIEALFAGEPWVGFDRFMGFALLDPDHGFYSQARPVFGDQGHFVTAPLLGDWLARLVTQEALELAMQLKPLQCDFTIREYGPGNGRLAADLLLGMGRQAGGPDRYEFIEQSAARQAEQGPRRLLAALAVSPRSPL
jgi:SAM-dependent MidA family methyltransferase